MCEVTGTEKANWNPEAQTGTHTTLEPTMITHHPQASQRMMRCFFFLMAKLNTHLAEKSEKLKEDLVEAKAAPCPSLPDANKVNQQLDKQQHQHG